MQADEETVSRGRPRGTMTRKILSAGSLLALGALGAWAGTSVLASGVPQGASPGIGPIGSDVEATTPASSRTPVPSTPSAATAGPAWGPERQVTSGASGGQGAVGRTLALLPDGTRVIVWRGAARGGAVMLSRSADGERWSAPEIIGVTQFAMAPNVGVAPDGTLHLVWGQRQGPRSALMHASSPDGGRTWSSPTAISPTSDVPLRGQTLAVDGQGRVHVAWHLGDPGRDPTRATVYYARSVTGGRSFSEPQQLGAAMPGHSAFPRLLLTGASGDLVAVPFRAQQDPPDWDVVVAISTDGGVSFTEQVAVDTPFDDWDPEAWVDASGSIHLAWMTQRGRGQGVTIDYARSDDQGRSWTPARTLSRVNSRFPSWAPSPDGTSAWLTWKDERDFGTQPCVGKERCADLAGAWTGDGGRTWTEPELFTDMGELELKFPSVAVDRDGRLQLMWSDRRDGAEQIYFQERQAP